MPDQAYFWSQAAGAYEENFIDPFRSDVKNPLLRAIWRAAKPGTRVAADLGCGIGPLLPLLAKQFQRVYAVDFADKMLERARERTKDFSNVEFLQRRLSDLADLAGRVDVAIAVNSLVTTDIPELERSLRQVHSILRPGGHFIGIVPAMDAVHYYTMVLVDRALSQGKTMEAARKNAAHFNEHSFYDFAFSEYRYLGLEQHFWQPFEVRYRLRRAGFRRIRQTRVFLSWEQIACAEDLKDRPPPWDWFFEARID